MIQLFNKWISGFSTVKKTLGGREYRFRYQDKPVFFDAVGMLGEFAQRIKERDVQEVDLVCSQSQIESNFINPADKSLPKVISLFSKGRKELKVSRYVMRVQKPIKLTPVGRSKLTPSGRSKLTPASRSKLTPSEDYFLGME
jgi:hypothetical protein